MAQIGTRRIFEGNDIASPGTRAGTNIAAPMQVLTAAGVPVAGSTGTLGAGGLPAGGGPSGTSGGDWKSTAWTMYDQVGELRYVCAWLSNALSRCELRGSDLDLETGQPTGSTESEMVRETVAAIAGGPAGQAALLGRLGTYLTVPGEGFVAIIVRQVENPQNPGSPVSVEEWYVLSTDEVTKGATGETEITLPDRSKHVLNDQTDTLARIYRPHPRKSWESDSPVRAAIPILREIVHLGQHIEATTKSRLAGNGLMLVPQEITMPKANAPTGDRPASGDPDAPGLPLPPVDIVTNDKQVSSTDVMQALVQAASTALGDPSSAASLVPIILQAQGEYLDKVRHVKLGSEFTDVVMKLREAATKRLALSLDVPAEILLGTGDMNHWSAWQIEESAIKLHVEPLMTIICDRLTEFVLRPMLELQGHPDPDSVVLWFSADDLALRPNRSQDAKDLFDRGVISATALRQASGFNDTDVPIEVAKDDATAQKELAMQLVTAAPSLLPLLAGILGLPIVIEGAPAASETDADEQTGAAPAEQSAPTPAEPEEIAASIAGARVCVQAGLQRALQLAGDRMGTRGNLSKLSGVKGHDTHAALGRTISQGEVDRLITGWEEVLTPSMIAAANVSPVGTRTLVRDYATRALTGRKSLTQIEISDHDLRAVVN